MSVQKIAPAATVALREALTNIYWYKGDLRGFLTSTLTNPAILSRLDWGDYKRNIVSALVGFLECRQDDYQVDLLRLMSEVARIDDFSHLERLEGGREKATAARAAVRALRKLTEAHDALFDEQKRMEERRRKAHEEVLRTTAVRAKLEEITQEYLGLLSSSEPQQRGYRLERIIRQLFEAFDLDPRASFKIVGEQIDGAFSFQGTDYIEAATKAYRLAWCDGPPYAYHWGLEAAKKDLRELGAPEPAMPLFDESKYEPMVEVEINPPDEYGETESTVDS